MQINSLRENAVFSPNVMEIFVDYRPDGWENRKYSILKCTLGLYKY